uniref:Uncharacterized protein n=1 Tax=viral metagenome TaxID=1070528 RepID=A0A6M3X992_9ZZZZ
MPEMTISFEVFCRSCGAGLCNNTRNISTRNSEAIEVEPCGICIEKARSEGYDKGYDDGNAEGEGY